ncbi:DUF503 family protein [candidate division KSB1 bacterium]|nr:DUF503 family protein [candidate division KSB1 bacterium]
MFVGLLQLDLMIPESGSLKEKRFVLKSIKTRIRNKFNVSVAEVDHLEKWQRTVLGIALVCNERKFIDKTMNQILNLVDDDADIQILEHQLEVL